MEVLDYRDDLKHHFDTINRQWIDEYFELEPIDEEILTKPYELIVEPGGAILFGEDNGKVIGTVALKKHDAQTLELMKMGVYSDARNRGYGKQLIEAAKKKAKEMGFSKLVLYSNRKLENAIHLYRKMGFQELSCYNDLYERCDIQMEMSL